MYQGRRGISVRLVLRQCCKTAKGRTVRSLGREQTDAEFSRCEGRFFSDQRHTVRLPVVWVHGDLFDVDLPLCPQMVKNMKGLGQNISDARFSLGKFLWLAVTHCVFSPDNSLGPRKHISVLYSSVIPPMAPMGPLTFLTFGEANFIGKKYFQMQISRNDLIMKRLGK